LTKKAKLDVEKNKKIKKNTAENTALPPTATQKPTHKAQRVAVCGSAIVLRNKKKAAVLRLNERNKIYKKLIINIL
jgi:hypothetical protein